jgi:hypothetical protein
MEDTQSAPTTHGAVQVSRPLVKRFIFILMMIFAAAFVSVFFAFHLELERSASEPLADYQILMGTEADSCVRDAIRAKIIRDRLGISRGDVIKHRNCENKTNLNVLKAQNDSLVEQKLKSSPP